LIELDKKLRYAISSHEEIWVKVCYKFFANHDFTYWYVIDRDQAFSEMMQYSNGTMSPTWLRNRIDELYKSVGV
jgi:hypothetical protein